MTGSVAEELSPLSSVGVTEPVEAGGAFHGDGTNVLARGPRHGNRGAAPTTLLVQREHGLLPFVLHHVPAGIGHASGEVTKEPLSAALPQVLIGMGEVPVLMIEDVIGTLGGDLVHIAGNGANDQRVDVEEVRHGSHSKEGGIKNGNNYPTSRREPGPVASGLTVAVPDSTRKGRPPGPDSTRTLFTDNGAMSLHRAADAFDLASLDQCVESCSACARLVDWRSEVAQTKRAAFRDQTYWGRAVAGFGPADARIMIVGLAPAAHGANRTGRMFTGDRSGEVLYQALYDVGLASHPTSTWRGDGLELHATRITAPVHCAPPDNKPTPEERDTCRPWLVREFELLQPTLHAVVVLGGFGWQALLPALSAAGWPLPRPRPRFAHGAHVVLPASDRTTSPLELFGCFHVSQRNTQTGRLTPAMLRTVLQSARDAAGAPPDTGSNQEGRSSR